MLRYVVSDAMDGIDMPTFSVLNLPVAAPVLSFFTLVPQKLSTTPLSMSITPKSVGGSRTSLLMSVSSLCVELNINLACDFKSDQEVLK